MIVLNKKNIKLSHFPQYRGSEEQIVYNGEKITVKIYKNWIDYPWSTKVTLEDKTEGLTIIHKGDVYNKEIGILVAYNKAKIKQLQKEIKNRIKFLTKELLKDVNEFADVFHEEIINPFEFKTGLKVSGWNDNNIGIESTTLRLPLWFVLRILNDWKVDEKTSE
jgi:hypothetical protein